MSGMMREPGYIERCEAYGEERPGIRSCLCADCGEWILRGEPYLPVEGRRYCERCVADMPARELLGLLGVGYGRAE